MYDSVIVVMLRTNTFDFRAVYRLYKNIGSSHAKRKFLEGANYKDSRNSVSWLPVAITFGKYTLI